MTSGESVSIDATAIEALVDNLVEAAWSPDLPIGDWWSAMADARLSFPHWPEPWGRSWGKNELATWRSRLEHHGVIGPPTGLGVLMGGPIVIDHGTPEQQQRFLPGLANGTSSWCQLFSEPGAGSDLAGLTTTAVKDGDDWIVTGQKVWTSGAEISDRGMLIARTNWDVPKHQGVSYFIMDMDQPGVDVRPLEQMNGASHFNEVFLNEARVADADLIGSPGTGWRIATDTLGYERRGLGAATVRGPRTHAGTRAGQLEVPVGDIVAKHRRRTEGESDTAAGSSSRLAALAQGDIRAVDRDRLAALVIQERVEGWVASRQPLAAKLAWTERLRAASDVGSAIAGAQAMLTGSDGPASFAKFMLSIPAASIAGGTDEIQRNILAERGLQLPREPSDAKNLPFRDVPRNG